MSAETWVKEFVRLREIQRELKQFLEPYEMILAQIAAAHWRGVRPCPHCRAQVTTLVTDDSWYFEWECRGYTYGYGRCSVDAEGWYVSMDVVHIEIEKALAAKSST